MYPTELLGEWQLRRRLRDRGGMAATMTGSLILAGGDAEIGWSEQGTVHWSSGLVTAATRQYRLRDGADGWWVHFADGRPFHPWTPGRWVTHPCRADVYRGLVHIDSPVAWRVLWDVAGPAKDQRIVTVLSRSDG